MTTTCPVLAFTPAVESALRWFDATHELDTGFGTVRWRRIGLPGAGALGEQDARLMEALDLLRDVHNDMAMTKKKTTKKDTHT